MPISTMYKFYLLKSLPVWNMNELPYLWLTSLANNKNLKHRISLHKILVGSGFIHHCSDLNKVALPTAHDSMENGGLT